MNTAAGSFKKNMHDYFHRQRNHPVEIFPGQAFFKPGSKSTIPYVVYCAVNIIIRRCDHFSCRNDRSFWSTACIKYTRRDCAGRVVPTYRSTPSLIEYAMFFTVENSYDAVLREFSHKLPNIHVSSDVVPTSMFSSSLSNLCPRYIATRYVQSLQRCVEIVFKRNAEREKEIKRGKDETAG